MKRPLSSIGIRTVGVMAAVGAVALIASVRPIVAADSPKPDAAKTAASKPAAETKRIEQAKDGTIVLAARDAAIHGTTLRYEPDKNTIGYWFKRDDWVSWDLHVSASGTFVLELLQGCGSDSAGSHYTVEIADQKMQDKVQDTGSFHNFRLRKVGEVKIDKPGDYTLSVRVDDKPGRAVMDLRAVTLTPPNLKKVNPFKLDLNKADGPPQKPTKSDVPSSGAAKPEK